MSHSEVLNTQELRDVLEFAVQDRVQAVMSHLSKGKWQTTKVNFVAAGDNTINIELDTEGNTQSISIQVDQPVGMTFRGEHSRYLFETIITGFDNEVNSHASGQVVVATPEKIEKMQRRAEFRATIPQSLKVKVLFWHRGYNNDETSVPEESYWQGKLIDLSSGGVQIGVKMDQEPNFNVGQLIGLQFTPMPFQKPIQVEAQIKHIARTADENGICLGVQFVGLEATANGRLTLQRIVGIANTYHKKNQNRDPHKSVGVAAEQAHSFTEEPVGPSEGSVEISEEIEQFDTPTTEEISVVTEAPSLTDEF